MWNYANIDSTRQAVLGNVKFDDLVSQLQECKILKCEVAVGNDSPIESFRIEYCLYVGEDLFDHFFNSEHGYRGAYFRSAAQGLGANAQLLFSLCEILLAHKPIEMNDNLDREKVDTWVSAHAKKSLIAASAKVWLCEAGKETVISKCCGEWSAMKAREMFCDPERAARIQNGKWRKKDSSGGVDWQDGTLTPRLCNLHISGALIGVEGDEWVAPRKVLRAHQIFETGWT